MNIALVGDSIIDNNPYVENGQDVLSHLRHLIPNVSFTKTALDGSITENVTTQVVSLEGRFDGIVISTGGNDALAVMDEQDPFEKLTVAECFVNAHQAKQAFELDYSELMEAVKARSCPVLILTVYNPRFQMEGYPAEMQMLAEAGLSVFNDIIQSHAIENHAAILDLRRVCNTDEDFANSIEPSNRGGEKIAQFIKRWIATITDGSLSYQTRDLVKS